VVNKRNTIQRQAILGAVRELNAHATAEQVVEHISKRHPAISRATVYRNLAQMSETGELLNIGNFFGSARYDHNCHTHCHFVCEDCKRIFDVNIRLPGLHGNISGMDGFEIKSHVLSLSGICRDCNALNRGDAES